MKKFNLKQWRKKHGMTQIEFAKLVGLCRDTISVIENGGKTKTGPLVEKFCQLYDILKERK
jgi:HTH-type transcriptional regulator/antitoxin PezA